MYLTFIYLKVYKTDWKNLVLYFLWSEDSSGHYNDSVFFKQLCPQGLKHSVGLFCPSVHVIND